MPLIHGSASIREAGQRTVTRALWVGCFPYVLREGGTEPRAGDEQKGVCFLYSLKGVYML